MAWWRERSSYHLPDFTKQLNLVNHRLSLLWNRFLDHKLGGFIFSRWLPQASALRTIHIDGLSENLSSNQLCHWKKNCSPHCPWRYCQLKFGLSPSKCQQVPAAHISHHSVPHSTLNFKVSEFFCAKHDGARASKEPWNDHFTLSDP